MLTLEETMKTFAKDERGGLVIFALYMMIIMLMVGGIGVDLMHFEAERKRVQHTVDNAALAASALSQQENSEAIARSYIEKSGYNPDDFSISIDETTVADGEEVIARTVSVGATLSTETMLMSFAGVDTLSTPVGTSANETIQNIEISLVLDISGSMRFSAGSKSRINALKDAVENFVDIVLAVQCNPGGNNCVQSPDSASTTINIIPYAGHVNPGRELFNIMGGRRWHNWSSCIEVDSSDFNDALLPNDNSNQLPHFMRWNIDGATMNWGWCPKDDAAIMVAENDAQTIKDFVRGIRLHDGTATHVGMKYGLALLDPSSRDEFNELYNRGEVAEAYRTRPANYEDSVVKYLIVMTDGQITDQFRPDDADYDNIYADFDFDDRASDFSGDVLNRYLSWAAVFDRYGTLDSEGNTNPSENVEYGYPDRSIMTDPNNVKHNRSRNITNFAKACTEAKEPVTLSNGDIRNDRVTVFAIAFHAPEAAQTQMSECASSPNKFWNVENLDINTAFTAIAMTINKLKLTQ